jgi:flagella basal body P-ring formation protein FlgA
MIKLKSILLVALALASPCMASPYVSTAEVRLIDSIAVEAPWIKLGEIATIQSSDPELKKELSEMVVENAPTITSPRLITPFKIKSALKNIGKQENVIVYGQQCHVYLETRILHSNEIKELIESWVITATQGQADAEIDSFQVPDQWKVPAGKHVEIVLTPSRQQLDGNVILTLKAICNNKVMATSRVKAKISRYQETAVLVKHLERGAALTDAHVEVRRVKLQRHNKEALTDFSDFIGMEARVPLKSGTQLSYTHFDKPLLVKRGSLTRIIIKNGPIRMSVSGAEALQSGREGEIVLFKNPINRKQNLRAKIIGKGIAMIDLH